jgi:CheY-like chemotaxis protein
MQDMSLAYTTHVLVIDDDPDIRYLLRELLEEEGFVVSEAADGVEAWDILRSTCRPAVAIIDHNMPNLDGPGLMAYIANDTMLLRRVAVIYTTAAMHGATPHGIPPALQHLLDDLSAFVLWKPFEVEDLIRAVVDAALLLSRRDETDVTAPAWYR